MHATLCRDDELIATLRELDAAKALVRERKAELLAVANPNVSDSSNGSITFEARVRAMNDATAIYRQAVAEFNRVCGRSCVVKPTSSVVPSSELFVDRRSRAAGQH